MLRPYRLLRPVTVVLLLGIVPNALGQMFVSTVADTPEVVAAEKTPTAAEINQLKTFVTANQRAVRGGTFRAFSVVTPTPTEAQLFEAIFVAKQAELEDEPEDVRDAAALAEACKKVANLVNAKRPTRWNSYRTACFWRQSGLQTLRAATLSGNSDQGTAAVEVLSALFWGLRMTVNSSVSAAGEPSQDPVEEQKRKLQQLITSGGNLSFAGTYPWYLFDSTHPEKVPPSPREASVRSLVSSYARLGTVIPTLGESTDTGASKNLNLRDFNANLELGLLQADVKIGSYDGDLTFVAFGKIAGVQGTRLFRDTVGQQSSGPFLYGQLGTGIRIGDFLYILGSWSGYSGNLKSPGATVTIAFGK